MNDLERLEREASRYDSAVARIEAVDGRVPALVRRARLAAGWTQVSLAAALDVTPAFVSNLEHARKPTNAATLRRIAVILRDPPPPEQRRPGRPRR